MFSLRALRHFFFGFSVASLACLSMAGSASPAAAQDTHSEAETGPAEKKAKKRAYDYKVEVDGLYPPSLLDALKNTLPLYTQRKERPKSRAQLRDRIDRSLKVAQTVLQSEGYYAGRISGRLAPRIDRSAPLPVKLTIQSGKQYVYGTPTIRMAEPYGEDLIGQLAETAQQVTPTGKRAAANLGVRLAPALKIRLKELGHPFASVSSERFIVDHAASNVRPDIEIDPGPKARIRSLEITGLETVEPGYVRLLADISEGPVYDQRKIDAFRDRLIQTSLFSGIQLTPLPPTTPADQDGVADIALQADLSEAPLRQVSVQAGFSTDEGFSVEGAWTHRNFFGRGEVFTVRGRMAELEQSVETILTLPNFKRIDQSLNLSLGFGREDTDAFNLLSITSAAILERRLSKRWVASAGGRLEAQRVEDDLGRRTFYLGGLPLSARYDGADDVFDPQDGLRLNVLLTPEAGVGDASLFFLTSDILLRGYKSFNWLHGTVLAARARVGAVFGEDTTTLPANRRFYAGGGGSIRGYGFQNVGPLDSIGNPFGGRSLIELSAEARVKVTPTIGVVPFLDVGNVYASALPKFSGLQYGAGIGLRYHTQFAPIRFDIGTPINPRPGDDRIQVYISIGQSF